MDSAATENLLARIAAGDDTPATKAQLLEMVYQPMRMIARGLLRREAPDSSLHPTELVHAALLTRVLRAWPHAANGPHFLGILAQSMREVLFDRARRRATRRQYAIQQSTSEARLAPEMKLAVTREMGALKSLDPIAARVVYLRDVEKLGWKDIAVALQRAESSCREDYRFAIGWLKHRLR